MQRTHFPNHLTKNLFWTIAMCFPCMAVAPANAGPPEPSPETSFTYQGVLEESNQPVTGVRTMRFSLTTDPTGESVGGGAITLLVDIDQGLFNVFLDFGDNIVEAYANVPGQPQWHILAEVQEPDTTFTKLLPPQPITAVPFSANTRGIKVDTDKNVFVERTLIVGAAEDAMGDVTTAFNFDLGDGSGHQNLLAFSAQPMFSMFARLGPTPSGETGQLQFLDSTGTLLASLGATDVSGINAGRLALLGETGTSGGEIGLFSAQGPETVRIVAGDAAPRLTMTGPINSLAFDMSQLSGDDSINLPINAINANETLNEAGLAFALFGDVPQFTGEAHFPCFAGDPFVDISIFAPSDGFIIATFTATATLQHVPGNLIVSNLNFDLDGSAIGSGYSLDLTPAMPPGTYNMPVTLSRVIPVDAGVHTIGVEDCVFGPKGITVEVWGFSNIELIALFVPTNYQVPNPTPLHAGSSDTTSPSSPPQRELFDVVTQLQIDNSELRRRLDDQRAILDRLLLENVGELPPKN